MSSAPRSSGGLDVLVARAASIFPRPHGDPLTTNHLGHGIPLRFAESPHLHDAVNALALPRALSP